MSKQISEVFDVEPVESKLPAIPTPTSDNVVEQDAEYAQNNIKQLIELGIEQLREAASVASTSESPRAYEVVSTMIKNISDMNLQLLDIHTKMKQIREPAPGQQQTGQQSVTNNAIFVGTTKDINELIMKRLGQQ